MEDNIQEIMNKIKKKDLAYLYGQMEENILVIGKMGSKMDKIYFI